MAHTHSENARKALEFAVAIGPFMAEGDIAPLAPYRGQTAMFMTIVRLFTLRLLIERMEHDFLRHLIIQLEEYDMPDFIKLECLYSFTAAPGTGQVLPGGIESDIRILGFDAVDFVFDPLDVKPENSLKANAYDFCLRLNKATEEYLKTGNIVDKEARGLFRSYLSCSLLILQIAGQGQPNFLPSMDTEFFLECSNASEDQAAYMAEFGTTALRAMIGVPKRDEEGETFDITA